MAARRGREALARLGARIVGARRWQKVVLAVLALAVLCRHAHRVIPNDPLRLRFSSSLAVLDAHGRLLRLTTARDDTFRLWTPLGRISPALVEATLLYEDQHFHRHFALNPVSLLRALRSVAGGGRRIGGSTITMQLARRLHGIDSRTPWGKAWQILCAAALELVYSKEEILEAYLNLVPYGHNIEGVGAASRIYFGKLPGELTAAEALTLAVIPQSPTRRAPGRGGLPPALTEARAALLERWLARHPEAGAEARGDAPLRIPPAARMPEELPFLAPHFTDTILAESGAETEPSEIATTLDLGLQRLIERQTRAYVARQRPIGIRNAAVLLVDVRTLEVKAQLGSADFRSGDIHGQIDGTRARRSPGSALKPFVYALGLEQGIIHPHTMLKDTPQSFAAWVPENFDGRYVGPISARDALIRSRNVPALAIAAQLNRPSFYDFLKTAGIGQLRAERHYGLALALGGAEVTMEELVALYAALARGGVLHPLRRRVDEPPADGTRVLSAEASWVTIEMLRRNPRPDRAFRVDAADDRLPVAWKTGTSWGFRDAWAVGLLGPYALAVWVGEFDNRSNPAFVGVQAAAPLFFHIVDALVAADRALAPLPFPRPDGVRRVEVCAVSGQLPSASCRHRVPTHFLPGRSPIDVCTIHRPVLVDDTTGLQTCSPFGDGHSHSEVYEFWPSDMLKLFAQAGLPRRSPPPLDPRCALAPEAARSTPPRITSPLAGATYTIQPDRPTDQIALQAITDAAAHDVYWFVDQMLVGRARAGTALLWTPRPGRFVVRVVDDLGLSDSRPLRVEVAH